MNKTDFINRVCEEVASLKVGYHKGQWISLRDIEVVNPRDTGDREGFIAKDWSNPEDAAEAAWAYLRKHYAGHTVSIEQGSDWSRYKDGVETGDYEPDYEENYWEFSLQVPSI